ncbi:MAG: sulfate adenylyltransferase [Armatimonadetes bacterium]|nr:sulfate adenylyltransferase [Armatimonadota bacterium]MDW8120779.1 sulfate adenylyltransferase [Armatimonadota bacterium]
MTSQPHGGVLVDRLLAPEEAMEAREKARSLVPIVADQDTVWDAEKIAIGAFSPLTGFMTAEEVQTVVADMRLPSGLVWSFPILLPVEEETVSSLRGKKEAVVTDGEKTPIAVIAIQDIFRPDKTAMVKEVFGTDDPAHPGVARILSQSDWYVGGDLWLIQRPANPYRRWEMTPRETRAYFDQKGWKTVAGFQTRNAPHRAHEYLQRCALEICDGLLIQPIMGTKKGDDFPTEAILTAYEALIASYFPPDRVLLSGITTWMRYAGPKEAVFHAIFRKNYGCTHFLVGRDHAGVGNYYDPFAAHRIYDQIPDLGITILKVGAAFYCRKCESLATDKTCGHDPSYRLSISMTALRKMLRQGETPPPELIRPEVAQALADWAKSQAGEG